MPQPEPKRQAPFLEWKDDEKGKGRRRPVETQSTWHPPGRTGTYTSGRQIRRRVQEDPDGPVIAEAPQDSWARRGDWVCPKCGDSQFEKNIACRMCFGPKPQFTRCKDGTIILSGTNQTWMGDYFCPECKAANFARNKRCRSCTTPKPEEPQIFDCFITQEQGKGKQTGKGKGMSKGKAKGGKPEEGPPVEPENMWANYRPSVRLTPYSERSDRGSDRTGNWSNQGTGASSTGQSARAAPHETDGKEYCVGNREWMM